MVSRGPGAGVWAVDGEAHIEASRENGRVNLKRGNMDVAPSQPADLRTLALRVHPARVWSLRQHRFGEVQPLLRLAQLLPQLAHVGVERFEGVEGFYRFEPNLALDFAERMLARQEPLKRLNAPEVSDISTPV